jgi:hypothetical protein
MLFALLREIRLCFQTKASQICWFSYSVLMIILFVPEQIMRNWLQSRSAAILNSCIHALHPAGVHELFNKFVIRLDGCFQVPEGDVTVLSDSYCLGDTRDIFNLLHN